MLKLLLASVAFALVSLVAFVGPQPLAAACHVYCDTSYRDTTPTATAIGSSCAIAQTNLQAQLKSYADSVCGSSCQLVYTTTVACQASGGGYSVSGYATFSCRDSTC
jgi:hypothetical protein